MKLSKKCAKETPDKELIGLVIAGDQSAFAQLVERHMTPVFRFSYSLLCDAGKAEDITQETFMRLWQQADRWQPTGQLRSWLFRIARNLSIDEIRSRKDHVEVEKVTLKDNQKSPHENTFASQLKGIIEKCVMDLPERQREAITLVHFLGCSNIEAAQIMESSVDAVESLLARARKKLKITLGDYRDMSLLGGYNE